MKQTRVAVTLLILLLFNAIIVSAQKSNWTSLFNAKNLNGWDTYIGPPLDDDGKMITQIPVGLNTVPKKFFL